MSTDTAIENLAKEIRRVYADNPDNPRQAIETLLGSALADFPAGEAKAAIRKVAGSFGAADTVQAASVDSQIAVRVFSLILGRRITADDLTSTELLERLGQSMNTIFDSLNQLISVINMTLNGGRATGEQTIRQVIGYHLEGEDQVKPLEAYLGQINKAFLTTHEAFKKTVTAKMKQVIDAVDPKAIAAERGHGGLKIGPLRKAEDYDILKEKIERIQRWFESDRFMEDFLREFERNCQESTVS